MAKTTRNPNDIFTDVGNHYVQFKHLNNIKNTSTKTYAETDNPIQSKNQQYNRPAPVTCRDFKFNIPSNAVVRKVTVHYRHRRLAVKNGAPSTDKTIKCCNIPAPTINLLNTSKSAKGQAPARDGKHNTLTFKGEWNASVVNSNKFGVKINYPSNTNTHQGYVFLTFVYIEIEYFTPSFSLKAVVANTGRIYNHSGQGTQNLALEFDVSDVNTTGKGNPTVLVEVPSGFSYAGRMSMDGTSVEHVQNNLYRWRTKAGQNSNWIFTWWDVNITFPSGQDTVQRTFKVYIKNTSIEKDVTVTVYKERPRTEETTDPIPTDSQTEKDIDPESDTDPIPPDDYFDYITPLYIRPTDIISLTVVEPRKSSHVMGDVIKKWIWLESDIDGIQWKVDGVCDWRSPTESTTSSDYVEQTEVYKTSGVFIGDIKIRGTKQKWGYVKIRVGNSDGYSNWYGFNVRFVITEEQLESFTTPNFVRFGLTEEELNRMGDSYGYTVQSDIKLVQTVEEGYIKDWYKNCRIGVFNNPILANCSTYYQYKNTATEFEGYFYVPALYDITDATLKMTVDNPITLTINNIEYDITTTQTIDMFEAYNVPVTFERVGNDEVEIQVELYDSENTKLWEATYKVKFNAEETKPLEEITVDTTDYTNLTDEEIFDNAKYWGETVTHVNTTESLHTEFTYKKDYPLYILITGDYPQGNQPNNTIQFDEPCIIETSTFTDRLPNGKYPVPIDSLVLSEDSSEITLEPSNKSETIVFYKLPLDDNYGTNEDMAIRGIEVTGEIQQADRMVIYARLNSPTGASRERSIVINDTSSDLDNMGTFSIGGNGDLWGFSTLDIVNLENWELDIGIANNLEDHDGTINLNNIQIILYIETVDKQNVQWKIEGEDTAYYGVFITDRKIPEGLETDTAYLKVDGTDTNDAYRQNIKEKEITVEFEIGEGCDLEASTLSLREFTKLLVNERDEYNRPIPKTVEFSDYPDVYWEYVMEEALETTLEISTYKCKCKLTIPAGTSYDKKTTTTSSTGYINGLASINPIILVKPTNETITITETVSGQEFHMGYSDWQDRYIQIDCEDRIVWLQSNEDDVDPINMNKYVDFNSDWFSIIGEYAFEGTGCTVLTVDYQERW